MGIIYCKRSEPLGIDANVRRNPDGETEVVIGGMRIHGQDWLDVAEQVKEVRGDGSSDYSTGATARDATRDDSA